MDEKLKFRLLSMIAEAALEVIEHIDDMTEILYNNEKQADEAFEKSGDKKDADSSIYYGTKRRAYEVLAAFFITEFSISSDDAKELLNNGI